MTITYKNSSSNQDADKNKSLIGKLEITDMSGNSILPETSTGSSSSPITSEKNLYGLKVGDLVDVLYPVGMVVEFGEDINPNEIDSLVGTKWERYAEGRVTVGYSSSDTNFNSVGKTGGSKTINLAHSHTVNSHTHTTQDHTLTIEEIPAHTHPIVAYSASGSDYSNIGASLSFNFNTIMKGYSGYTGLSGRGGSHNHGSTTASSPGTNSQLSSNESILNPYIVSAKWIRIE